MVEIDPAQQAAVLTFVGNLLSGQALEGSKFGHSVNLSRMRIRRLPGGMNIRGDLILQQCQRLAEIGAGRMSVAGSLSIGGKSLGDTWWRTGSVQLNDFGEQVVAFLGQEGLEAECPLKELPGELEVGGSLALRQCSNLTGLPSKLSIGRGIEIAGCRNFASLPDGLTISGNLKLIGLPSLRSLPAGLKIHGSLHIDGLPIENLPPDIVVGKHIVIRNCNGLTSLPDGFRVQGNLRLQNCGIRSLPDNLDVSGDLNISRCPIHRMPNGIRAFGDISLNHCDRLTDVSALEHLNGSLAIHACPEFERFADELVVMGKLAVTDCQKLVRLPGKLSVKNQWRNRQGDHFTNARLEAIALSLAGCASLSQLPEQLEVDGAIDVGGTAIDSLLESQFKNRRFFWKGASVPAAALFKPESMSPDVILLEPNAESRRVMLERYGIDQLIRRIRATIVDSDNDPGGERRLIHVRSVGRLTNLRFLDCRCPSTARRYLLRIPETIQSCHAAAAWLAGFEDPSKYRPVQET